VVDFRDREQLAGLLAGHDDGGIRFTASQPLRVEVN
jgi:hypothetical protein